jgi:glutathione S-transferase
MKLFYSHTSPFARKCRVVAIETGIGERVQLVEASPADASAGIEKSNPLGKIPVLLRDDGSGLYDSPVICEYLDGLGQGGMFPPPGEKRWQALRRQALGDGIMDAAILRRYETTRPESQRSETWTNRQKRKVELALDALEADPLPDNLDIGTLTVAVALDYLDFRFAAEPWRERRGRLAKWHEAISRRPSLQSTLPKN